MPYPQVPARAPGRCRLTVSMPRDARFSFPHGSGSAGGGHLSYGVSGSISGAQLFGEAEQDDDPPTEVLDAVRPAEQTPAEESSAKADDSWRLVAAAQGGDTNAFARLYDRYVDVVYRYAMFRVGDRSLAEDLTSETFLRALRRISSISYQGRDVGAWFVTIVRNLVLDHVKSSRYRLEVSTGELVEPAAAGVTSGPEAHVLADATNRELLRCIDELGEDQRECVILRFCQGLSVAETAKLMGRGDGAIKALQHRAIRRLAQLLPSDIR